MNQQEKDKIVRKLIDTNTTISTMESCTSGLIASMITDTEGGIGSFFRGGYVTYLNKNEKSYAVLTKNYKRARCLF